MIINKTQKLKIVNYLFRKYRNKEIKEHKLNYLFWECTLRCNLNCLHCGSDCLTESNTKDMPVEDFINVLDNIKKQGSIKKLFICITGGEPLLRDDLEYVGREIIKRGFSWGIVTNALVLTNDRFKSLISAGLSSMSVSLDGLEQQHTFMRKNPKSFAMVSNAIDLMVKQGSLDPKFIFDVITCVHEGNFHILSELREFLIEKGVKQWRIFSIWPEGRAAKNEIALSNTNYVKMMDFIEETRNYKNKDNKSIKCNYSCEGYLGKYEHRVRDYNHFCLAGVHVGSVMCNGNISGCLSIRSKDFMQGNIYSEDFMSVWNNKFQNMRKRKWTKIGKCKNCKNWNMCLGNGIHLHANAKSEPYHCNFRLLNQ